MVCGDFAIHSEICIRTNWNSSELVRQKFSILSDANRSRIYPTQSDWVNPKILMRTNTNEVLNANKSKVKVMIWTEFPIRVITTSNLLGLMMDPDSVGFKVSV